MKNIYGQIEEKRFRQRIKIFYYARIYLLSIGFSILVIPALKNKFNIQTTLPHVIFFIMLFYSTLNVYINSIKTLKLFTFATLIIDNTILAILIINSGGLFSPIFSTQLVYLMFFTTLFPKPIFVLPPLLMIPAITRMDLLLGTGNENFVESIFMIIWISSISILVIYFIVLLDSRYVSNAVNIYNYQKEIKEKSILEEKNKIARDLHDGVGGGLSSLIIQAEYILSLVDADNEELLNEIKELKNYAEESMEEIRRSLHVIKNNFNLISSVETYIERFQNKNNIKVNFEIEKNKDLKLLSKNQLSLFRVIQEIFTNSLKYSKSNNFDFKLKLSDNLELYLNDHGKGFDPDKNYSGHYGLKNIKERISILGGEIKINSAINKETEIKLSVPNVKNNSLEVVEVYKKS